MDQRHVTVRSPRGLDIWEVAETVRATVDSQVAAFGSGEFRADRVSTRSAEGSASRPTLAELKRYALSRGRPLSISFAWYERQIDQWLSRPTDEFEELMATRDRTVYTHVRAHVVDLTLQGSNAVELDGMAETLRRELRHALRQSRGDGPLRRAWRFVNEKPIMTTIVGAVVAGIVLALIFGR